jgi:hypothetical protein
LSGCRFSRKRISKSGKREFLPSSEDRWLVEGVAGRVGKVFGPLGKERSPGEYRPAVAYQRRR